MKIASCRRRTRVSRRVQGETLRDRKKSRCVNRYVIGGECVGVKMCLMKENSDMPKSDTRVNSLSLLR